MNKRRVVVTGLGIVSPVGNDIATAWQNVAGGVSGIGPITRFDASAFGTRMRGQGPFADLIAMRFAKTRRRLGFGSLPALRGDLFVAPRKASPQGELF